MDFVVEDSHLESPTGLTERSGSPSEMASTLDLDALMAELRAEVAARRERAGAETVALAPATCLADDLLKLPDADFVRAAEALVTGSDPSPAALSANLDRLLAGRITRTGLLRELLATPRAKARRAKVKGLWLASQIEEAQEGVLWPLMLKVGQALRTLWLLPRRVRQFIRRVEALEHRVTDMARSAEPPPRVALTSTTKRVDAADLGALRHARSLSATDAR